eukprot:1930581-Amphidinium_carterae.1
MPAEQPTDMFCVSNQPAKRFLVFLLCGGCFFTLATMRLKRQTLPMPRNFTRAKAAWYETCKQQNCLLLASCILLPLYSNMLLLACTVVADHVRFHVVGLRMPLEVFLAVLSHLWFFQSATLFHTRHVTQNCLSMPNLPRKSGFRSGHHRGSRVYMLWFLVCVLPSVQDEDN